jgi:hypothetical protein
VEPKDRGESLPVTAEVGDEGGSYADPTNQVATFNNDADRERDEALPPAPERLDDTARRPPRRD